MGAILEENSGATAVHPEFRNARMSMMCGTAWIIPGPCPHAETVVDVCLCVHVCVCACVCMCVCVCKCDS